MVVFLIVQFLDDEAQCSCQTGPFRISWQRRGLRVRDMRGMIPPFRVDRARNRAVGCRESLLLCEVRGYELTDRSVLKGHHPVTSRVEDIATRFEQANAELIATVEACSDDNWSIQCGSDHRSVGIVADHVANGHVMLAKWIQSIAAGQPMSVSMDAIHEANAQHATERAAVTRAEVVDTLRTNGQQAAEIIRSLNEDEIERAIPIAIMGGQEKSAAEMADMLLIGHISSHTDEIRSATGSS